MKLNGTCEGKTKNGEKILNGIAEEDETSTIPCSLNSEENQNIDKHFSKSLAESIGKLVNGYSSQVQQKKYQVR